MRIILDDPDKMSGKVLEIMLLEAEHQVIHTETAAEAIREVIGQETDAVLIDTDLPDMDGFTLCKELRARRYNGPILLVSESRSARDEMRSFMFGADDFMAKPFHPGVLIARLDAITRRYKRTDHQALGTILKVGNAQLSIGELTFQIDGQPSVTLTPTEMRLLQCLMRNSCIAIRRDTLIERTWGYHCMSDNNRIDVYIRRLRQKIEDDPTDPRYLQTVRGIGYVFRPQEPATSSPNHHFGGAIDDAASL
jgi:two-component system, OmpR family, response regulator RegX3